MILNPYRVRRPTAPAGARNRGRVYRAAVRPIRPHRRVWHVAYHPIGLDVPAGWEIAAALGGHHGFFSVLIRRCE